MKMSVRIALVVGIATAFGMVSCEKEYKDRYCDTESTVECKFDSTKVNVRVANYTGYPLCDFNIRYRKDDGLIYNYGTLEVDETSCYTTVDFTAVYPEVEFNLGTGQFTIADSLIDMDKYRLQKQTIPGFYTFIIQTTYPLDSQTVVTTFTVESIQ